MKKLQNAKEKVLQQHARDAKVKGWCKQCQYPWHGGRCTCGHSDELDVQAALRVGIMLVNDTKTKPLQRHPLVPCGQVMGQGEYCCEERLCGNCAYILKLEKQLGIIHDPLVRKAKSLEGLWEQETP